MSRNLISDQELTDRLYFSDKDAFDELYHRYWYTLYAYSLKKLYSSEDASKVVRDVFLDLWAKRQTRPLDFSVSQFLYTEVRRTVVSAVNQKLISDHCIVEELISDFSTEALLQSKLPVKKNKISSATHHQTNQNKESKFSSIFNVKWLRQGLVAKLN
ncbi:MAG: hypothetical protein WDN26_17635 [Chitinophagaceae bacterium]